MKYGGSQERNIWDLREETQRFMGQKKKRINRKKDRKNGQKQRGSWHRNKGIAGRGCWR